MKLAFVTMVWRDHWLLETWVRHNARNVPRGQLYVINHGGDPEVRRIAEGCNVIDVPRDELPLDLTRRRWDLLAGLTNGLMAFYDRVICTDVDELLVHVGDAPDLAAHLAVSESDAAALSPVGLNVMPIPSGAEEGAPILERYPHALLSAKYTKPCIAKSRVIYTVGGHGLQRGAFEIDPDIVLLHLHYVTPDYESRMAARQEIVAASTDHNAKSDAPIDLGSRHWINWARPDVIRDKEMRFFEAATTADLSQGFGACAERLRAAVVKSARKSVVEPSILMRDPVRVDLPERLRTAI
jgi:hypothetical protein